MENSKEINPNWAATPFWDTFVFSYVLGRLLVDLCRTRMQVDLIHLQKKVWQVEAEKNWDTTESETFFMLHCQVDKSGKLRMTKNVTSSSSSSKKATFGWNSRSQEMQQCKLVHFYNYQTNEFSSLKTKKTPMFLIFAGK